MLVENINQRKRDSEMNREIKFRGKSHLNNELVFGDLEYQRKKERTFIHTYKEDGSYEKCFEVEPDTVGQFTGLNDRNGTPIYEGDIVALPSNDIAFGIITWHDNGYFFINTSDGVWRSFGNDFRTLGEFMNLSDDHKIKVIGNIHDNLELMK